MIFILFLSFTSAEKIIYHEDMDCIVDPTSDIYNRSILLPLTLGHNNNLFPVLGCAGTSVSYPLTYYYLGYINNSATLNAPNKTAGRLDNHFYFEYPSSSADSNYFVISKFFQPYQFPNTTQLSFLGYTSTLPAPNTREILTFIFVNENNDCEMAFNLNSGSGLSAGINETLCHGTLKQSCNFFEYNSGNSILNASKNYHYINFTTNNCGKVDYTQKFKGFFIVPQMNTLTEYNTTLDEISLTVLDTSFFNTSVNDTPIIIPDIYNETGNETVNSLPTGDISFTTDECANVTYQTQNFSINLHLNFQDFENDRIYYSLIPTKYTDLYTSIEEDFRLLPSSQPDYSFLSNSQFYPINETRVCIGSWECDLIDALSPRITVSSYNEMPSYLNTSGKNEEYSSSLKSYIGSDWYFLPSIPLIGNITSQMTLIFPMQMNLNIKFVADNNNDLSNILFNQTNSTHLEILVDNAQVYNSTQEAGNHIQLLQYFEPNTALRTIVIYRVYYNQSVQSLYSYQIPYTPKQLKMVRFYSNNDGYSYYDSIRFYYLNYLYLASTSPSNFVTWTNLESQDVNTNVFYRSSKMQIFITDEAHKDLNDYKTYELNYDIPSCNDITNPDGNSASNYTFDYSNIDYNNEFRPDKTAVGLIKSPMQNYFASMGWTKLAEASLWFIFMLLFIYFLVDNFRNSGQIKIFSATTYASIICLLCSIATGFVIETISFLILLALSLAVPFASGLLGETETGKR